MVLGLVGLAWEWPLKLIAGTAFHQSIEIRLLVFPISALVAALLYQGTNAAIYYVVGMIVYLWGYSEGEVGLTSRIPRNISLMWHAQTICPEPWTLPKRKRSNLPMKA